MAGNQVSTSFPDATYSSANKPSTATLKTDIQALEDAHNNLDTQAFEKDGSVAATGNFNMNSKKITNLASPSATTDAANLTAVQAMWPIGSVFLSVVDTNPATLIGFGTWSQIAEGQMLIGQNSADADFDTAEETGGSKTATIAQANLPNISTGAGTAHTHTVTDPGHTHTVYGSTTGGTGNVRIDAGSAITDATSSATTGITNANESAHTHSLGGSGTAMDIVNPYFVVYAWKRTA